MSGVLFGVGVGPGDPDLMTRKAHRLISTAEVVAYPAPDSGESFARSIVAPFL
ncbi:MAG: SAM-dependent methyltransferase, partial [Pseudomonadota bacterium]